MIPIDRLHRALQSDLPWIGVAAVVLVFGLAAIALSRLRSRNALMWWLGIASVLYAARMLALNDLFRLAYGLSADASGWIVSVITCCILIPYVLFWRELLGECGRKWIAIWLWVQIAFAPLGIAFLMAGYGREVGLANNTLVIAGTAMTLWILWKRYRPEHGGIVLKVSVSTFLAAVLITNLVAAPSWLEADGFLVLIGGLAYVAVRHSVSQEEKLIAVEKELETARRIQASILPVGVPAIAGLRMAARYCPMTAVAGDFYDFICIDEHRVTVLVADVSGHGVPAALIASMLKVGFAAQASNARDPAAVLAGLNATLSGLMAGQFVTAACAFVDTEVSTVTYAGAGHPPSLRFDKNTAEVTELAENGLFLGPFRHAGYANVAAPFHPGDKLLMYTDGIIEACASQEPFGLEGLKHFLLKRASDQPAAFADELLAAVRGPVQEDDLTVVVAQRE